MTLLCMLSIVLAGLIGYRLLPVSDLPNVDFPTISVTAALPGANPDTMASTVTTPLEKEFTTIAGIDTMSSVSSQGIARITLQFVLSRDIDAAAQDVQAAISRASRRLPENMPYPPYFRKVNPADQPVLYLALTSPTLTMSALNEYGETMLAQRISMVDGVAQVLVYGSQKYAVRIQLDPYALASRNIGIDEVSTVIGNYNPNLPLGTLSGPHSLSTIQAEGRLMEASQFMPLIVSYRNGQPVRLQELGIVKDSVENDKVAAWYVTPTSRDRAIILAIQRQPGTNTIQVTDAIKQILPVFRAKLPASVSLEVLRDNSLSIKESARDVQYTLYLTLALVVLVIFLFLRNLSATVIPSMALPVSIIGTFAVMYLLDYSIDNLSLMALTLSVGFVVDDAIVMLENIVRHMEMGKTPHAGSPGRGTRGWVHHRFHDPVPVRRFYPRALHGRHRRSALPRVFRDHRRGRSGERSGLSDADTDDVQPFPPQSGKGKAWRPLPVHRGRLSGDANFYSWTLLKVLSHGRETMIFSGVILAATAYLFYDIPKGFIPSEDRAQISMQTEAAQNISFDAMVRHQMALLDIVQGDPNVARLMCNVGGGGGPAG